MANYKFSKNTYLEKIRSEV